MERTPFSDVPIMKPDIVFGEGLSGSHSTISQDKDKVGPSCLGQASRFRPVALIPSAIPNVPQSHQQSGEPPDVWTSELLGGTATPSLTSSATCLG